MDNSPALRRSVRKCKAVSSFTFPADHRTTSSRIKESRERSRIRKAIKKYRSEQKYVDKKDKRKDQLGRKDKPGGRDQFARNDQLGRQAQDQIGRKALVRKKDQVDDKEAVIRDKKKGKKTCLKVKFNWKKN